MKKKLLCFLISTAILLTLPLSTYANETQNNFINVMNKEIQNTFTDEKETLMFPLRETAEYLGLTVTWNADKETVEITDGNTSAIVYTKENKYETTSKISVQLETRAENKSGVVYVPCSFFETFFFVEQKTNKDGRVYLQKKQVEQPNVLGEFASLSNGNWFGLTVEEKLEDFDFLYKTLEENYPYFHVLERMHNVNLNTEYEKSRKAIAESKTDAEFYTLIEKFTRKANMVGHLSVISPFEYEWFVDAYKNTDGVPEEALESVKKIENGYANPKSQQGYSELQNKFWPVYEKVQDYYNAVETKEKNNTNDGQSAEKMSNVRTEILEDGKTAYIYVQSFDMTYYENDKKILFDFYEKVKDYENIIFDISENGGGGMSYFDDLIVAPNIDKALSANVYELAKDGEYNKKFMDFNEVDGWKGIENLPLLPKMNQEDLNDLDLMNKNVYTVEPFRKEKMLKGKIWILVSGQVFSSSEYAAMFTKETGFATLVGTQTGGDGIGSDPLPIVMPNSGIIVRYSPIYGITSDGTGSQEYGTIPDIISRENEMPLKTCLNEIQINNK